jgi:hypothetical protein
MKFKLLFLAYFLFSLSSLYAQKDYNRLLKSDVVTIAGANYTSDEAYLVTLADQSVSLQVQITGNAPMAIISRDNFVSLVTSITSMTLIGAFSIEAGLPVIETLEGLIGDPNMILNLIFAKSGVQIQITTAEGSETETITWEQLLN